nr:DUF3488 and transglutaminase-like domain-containing protein [Fodinicola feengrottensis]
MFNSIWGWLLPVVGAMVAVAASAAFARLLRVPLWLQPAVMVVGLALYVVLILVRTGNWFGIVPTPQSLEALSSLVRGGVSDVVTQSTPTNASAGLVLLTTVGVGMVAIVADIVAVGLRRPALAGLPMLALYAIPVSVTGTGIPWPLFVLGAGGYLWLISTDHRDRIRGWGRMMRPARTPMDSTSGDVTNTPIGAAGRRIGLIGIAVAVVIPLLLPSLPGSNLAALFNGGGFGGPGAGRATLVNPISTLKGQLTQPSNSEMLQLHTNETSQQLQYLRLATLDTFTPSGPQAGWSPGDAKSSARNRVTSGPIAAPGVDANAAHHTVKSSVKITGLTASPYLPVYPNSTKVDIDGDWHLDSLSGNIFSPYGKTGTATYQFTSTHVDYDLSALEAAPKLPTSDPIMQHYGAVPVLAQVQGIVDPLIRGKTTWIDKANAIDQYFRGNGFVYDTSTRPGNSGNDLVDFLQNKRGYCEQYASAMTYMARLAGLPARVAVGFTPRAARSPMARTRCTPTTRTPGWRSTSRAWAGCLSTRPPPDPNTVRTPLPWTQPDGGQGAAGSTTPNAAPTASASTGAAGKSRSKLDQQQDSADPAANGLAPTGPPPALWWGLGLLLAVLLCMLVCPRRCCAVASGAAG